ncbi:MAG: undecaprenyl-phosphate galactose phosphotransferase WbaP [Thermodesulfovibrio sp.]|nr:undecaprenyl-phosphate galactose phosphotransferase WbaP [Thermodesulfovibrio sp.]
MLRRRAKKLKNLAENILLFCLDVILIFGIFQLAVLIRLQVLPLFFSGLPQGRVLDAWWIISVWIFFFFYEGLYTMRASFWDEIQAICKVSLLSTAGVFVIVSIGKLSDDVSRMVVLLMGMLSFLLLPPAHMLAKKMLRQLGFLKRRVLILGAGKTGELILRALRHEPNFGYEVVGFVDDDPLKCGKKIEGIKVHRGIDKALSYINRADIEDIFIAMPGAGKERLQGLINHLQHKVERILFVPDIFGIAVLGTNLQYFSTEEAFALEMKNNLSNQVNMLTKWGFDRIVSLVVIPLLMLPMAAIALLIRLDSRGPVIFSQERVGGKGRRFRCYKFRTMYEDADSILASLLAANPELRDHWNQYWKLEDDPRITRIGRFLRITSLDELPQIFNVLKGEMSLVGPRPVTQEEIDMHYKDMAGLCFSVPPGITGLWQVSGRNTLSYAYRVGLDAWYVRNWNLWLDLVIILKTIRIVIKREGAY